jgi:murein DD-endopeptidase MepM/ murein hydrolase activator NlpD
MVKSCVIFFIMLLCVSCNDAPEITPIRVIAELNTGESREIKLGNGDMVKLELLGVDIVRDSLRNAIRSAWVKISVDGEEITLHSGNYNLPVTLGKVQIDCPVVKDYNSNTRRNIWELHKDARFRIWPAGSPFMAPGTFIYPVKQEWLASMSQSGNEPTYVDWGENLANKNIYYHEGHDIGGAEGLDEIVSATDGLVLAANGDTLEGFDDFPGDVRTDVIYILNDLGWYLRYSHLDSTEPAIKPGSKVKSGQRIGFMGKQGGSGGWVHLHFGISHKETSTGNWGIEDAYPYVWEAYVRQYDPAMIAVARPHHLLWAGQEATLDGRKSKSFAGDIVTYEWTFFDGTVATGPVQKKKYEKAGEYSEILKVTDSRGNIDYDFTVIQVYDRDNQEQTIPAIQPVYYPSLDIKPGDPVTFLVRTFNTAVGNEVWDFGDGSPPVSVKSETVDRQNFIKGKFAETIHAFSEPGHYVVSVERLDEKGLKAIGHLHVDVKNN